MKFVIVRVKAKDVLVVPNRPNLFKSNPKKLRIGYLIRNLNGSIKKGRVVNQSRYLINGSTVKPIVRNPGTLKINYRDAAAYCRRHRIKFKDIPSEVLKDFVVHE